MRTFKTVGWSLILVAVSVIGISTMCGSAWAQSATASILGQVTDQQGASVGNASVTVTNVATNTANHTTSDGEGNYRVLELPIGAYIVTAEHAGFSKLITDRVTLQINQQARVNLQLVIGAVSQTVEVSDVASNVETVNPTLGQSVTSRPIVNLPLNGRNVLNLALLQPGVTEDNPDDNNGQGIGGVSGFSVGGGRADSITYLLDGGVNNDLLGNEVVFNPNPDTVAEFRILTSNYTAEYGRNGSGVISVVTKSGSNQLHGSAFEFARNTNFDANSYFNKQDGLPTNDLKRHQFGGTVGGPITIPHLINGKDRLFFFLAYQGQRQTQTVVQSRITTFTPAELTGDFSQSAGGAPDPDVAAFLQANPYFQPNAGLAAQAIVDPTRIDPAAMKYIAAKLIPTSPSGLLSSAAGSTDNNNELTGKIDFNISDKDKISATIGGFRNPQIQPFGISNGYGSTVSGFPSTNRINAYFANVGYTRTFSPTVLNEIRVTAQRRYSIGNSPSANLPPASSFGFGIISDFATGPPQLSFDNGLGIGPNQAGPSYETGNTYALTDSLTWVRGHNTWKLGGGFSAYQNNTTYDFFGDGSFSYIGPYDQGGIGTGNSLADFLVGIPNNLFEGPNARNNIRSKSTYGFFQDEWRARPNLTLTLGIRYEYNTPKLDTQGRTFSIVPGAQSTRFPNAPLDLLFPGDKRAPTGVNFPDKNDFGPRIGFAWDPWSNGKSSIRGGFGIFYDALKGEDNLQSNGAPPFYSEPFVGYSCRQTVLPDGTCSPGPGYAGAATYYSDPWGSAGLPANPFPSAPPTAATAFANGQFLPFGGGGIYFVDPHLHTPYVYQYNLSFQHELAKNLVAEANYVGSSSKGLTSLQDINPFVLGTTDRVLNLSQNAAFTSLCNNIADGTSDCPLANALEFKNITFANYNSLEASLTKQPSETRFLGTTYFTLAYTYGHSFDNASGFRNRDSQVPYYSPMQFYSSSDFDITHRLTFSGGWDLPFDRVWSGGPKRLVRGWSLYPIFTWRTGFPLSVNAGNSLNPQDPGPSGAGDANLVNAVFAPGFSGVPLFNPHTPTVGANGSNPRNYYFNGAAFAIPDPSYVGYGTPRNFFRGPGRTNFDLALAKTTAITERLNLEFRLEAFNVLNHTEFANPDTVIGSGTFGEVTSTDLGTGLNTLHTERILQLAARITF